MSFLYLSLALLSFVLSTAVLFLLYLLGSLTPAIALASVAVLLITGVLIGYRIGFQEKYDTLERFYIFVLLYLQFYSRSVPRQPVDTVPAAGPHQPVDDTVPRQPVDDTVRRQPVDTVPAAGPHQPVDDTVPRQPVDDTVRRQPVDTVPAAGPHQPVDDTVPRQPVDDTVRRQPVDTVPAAGPHQPVDDTVPRQPVDDTVRRQPVDTVPAAGPHQPVDDTVRRQPVDSDTVPRQPIDYTVQRQPVDTVPCQPFIDYKGDIAARVINSNITLIKNSQLPLGSLTDKLFSLKIIGRRDKSNITSLSGRTDDEKMSYLLDIVIATIEGNGAVFGQLMEIFEQEGCLRGKDLANTLKTKYHKGKAYNKKTMASHNCF